MAVVLAAAVGLAGCQTGGGPSPAPAISATPTLKVVRPEQYICDTPKIAALGLGLKEYSTVPEAEELLRGVMPFPDPATLGEGAVFVKGYFNSGMQGRYKQSTAGLTWLRGDDEISVIYFNAYPPLPEPPTDPHEVVTIRGGTTAYLFEPPFVEGMHSVSWTEDGCRWITVGGIMTEEEVLKVAEGLMLPDETPPDASLALPGETMPAEAAPTDEPASPGPTQTE